MGNPADDKTRHLRESASAISLHTQDQDLAGGSSGVLAAPPPPTDRYFDDDAAEMGDDDDLPPLYSDLEHGATADQVGMADPLLPAGVRAPAVTPFKRDSQTGTEYYIDRRLDTDPIFLADQLRHLALLPPRPFVHVRGTHTETRRKSDNKTEQHRVVDFDIQVELTDLLYADVAAGVPQRRQMVTAANMDKVRRGTVWATRASGFGGKGHAAVDDGPGSDLLDDWCRHYCSTAKGLKKFSLRRHVVGFDFDALRPRIEDLVRRTNYRGSLSVDFPVQNAKVYVYNDCRTSRWRLTKWIEVLFVLTLLFLFAWPWLFFRTARWNVLSVEWLLGDDPTGSATSPRRTHTEDRWYNLWARPIQRAVLARRHGTLNQADLAESNEPLPQPQTGFAGAIQAGVEAMGVVNRSFGWGADT